MISANYDICLKYLLGGMKDQDSTNRVAMQMLKVVYFSPGVEEALCNQKKHFMIGKRFPPPPPQTHTHTP